jgi:Resolvase, N terminal domain
MHGRPGMGMPHMRKVAVYLRVTTANQERELRAVADRMSCEIAHVYRDHGVSGAKGRDKRPQFGKLCRDATKRQFDMVMARGQWTGSVAHCRIWLASCPKSTPSRSICIFTNKGSIPPRQPARRCSR